MTTGLFFWNFCLRTAFTTKGGTLTRKKEKKTGFSSRQDKSVSEGTINEGNDQSRDSFSDDIGDLFDDAILSLRKQSDTELLDTRKLDSFVSTDRNTPEALLEQPTRSSLNPTPSRRRSPRFNRE